VRPRAEDDDMPTRAELCSLRRDEAHGSALERVVHPSRRVARRAGQCSRRQPHLPVEVGVVDATVRREHVRVVGPGPHSVGARQTVDLRRTEESSEILIRRGENLARFRFVSP